MRDLAHHLIKLLRERDIASRKLRRIELALCSLSAGETCSTDDDGRVAKVLVRQGQVVNRGQGLIEMGGEH